MKKYLFVYLISFVCIQTCFGQTIQASIGAGSSPNKVIIYLKTNVTQTPAVFSTLQFNLAIPNTISPVPSVSAVSLAFTGVNWIVATPYDEDGMWNYNIYTAAAGYSLPVTTNTEFQALEISFQGGPGGVPTDVVRLTCLPDGGIVSGSGYFFCSGTLDSDGNNLFYDRDGAGPEVVVTNGNSYNSGGFPVGDFTSVARFTTGIVLPVSFSSFNVQCTDKGALITWSTESESNSEKFEVQQSINGTDWKIIGTIKAAGNST
ncbi:MAG TPA: hypothetical protein PK987_12270, partial [Ferruginibacter sp.]|nr:hypothetical protein [Ferruginibacter sp.]